MSHIFAREVVSSMAAQRTTNTPESFNVDPLAGPLSVLEAFARSVPMRFDRAHARRVLSESEDSVAGNDALAWSRRLVEAGESFALRVRTVECPLSEAITFVRQGIPVAFCSDLPEGGVRWLVLTQVKGRRLRVLGGENPGLDRWMSLRRLKRKLGQETKDSPFRWVIGQPALPCQAPRGTAGGESSTAPSPLARLIGLIEPEKKDLWVVLVFSIVVGVLALASPVAVEALVNTVAFGRYLQPIVVLAILLFVFLAFAAGMRGLITFVVEILQRRLFIRVVEDLAYRLPRVQQAEYDQRHGPELVNRFFDVVTLQKVASALLLDGISIVLQTLIGMAVLAFYHPFLLGFDVVLLLLISVAVFVLGRGAVGTAVKESKAKYAVAAWLEELPDHTSAFKLHSGSQFALARADQLAMNWLDARRRHFRIVMRQILFALGLQAFAATALLGLGGWLVILGELTLGQLVAAELIVMVIVGSFAKLGKHMESFYDLLAAVDKLGVLFDLPTESQERLFHLHEGTSATLEAHQVTYRFGSHTTLKDVSLSLAAGEAVAVTGGAGAGKSTLIDLLCGLRTPDSGRIELDGIDMRDIRSDSLRDQLAVARGIEIFQGTIDENVHLHRSNIRSKDVRSALKAVGLLDELLRLPDGLNTVVKNGGAPLSSSQAARLMLARAIIGRPRLLLIDGTLDGLPDDVLQKLLAGLVGEAKPWTLLIATGRSSVRDACDRVIELDADGRHQSA